MCFYKINMKNKHRLIAFFLVLVFVVSFLFFGRIFSIIDSLSDLTGAEILKTPEEKSEEYSSVCEQKDFSKNYRDCIYWEQEGEKQDSLSKLSDEAVESFCKELFRIYKTCE